MLTWWLPGCFYEIAPLDWLVGVVIRLFMLGNFPCSCCLLTFFKNLHFHVTFKKKSGTLSECQMVWIPIKTDFLSVLIRFRTACK